LSQVCGMHSQERWLSTGDSWPRRNIPLALYVTDLGFVASSVLALTHSLISDGRDDDISMFIDTIS